MKGKFGDYETHIGLTVHQATQFASIVAELDYFVEAWEWLDHLETLHSADKSEINRIRNVILEQHDKFHKQKKYAYLNILFSFLLFRYKSIFRREEDLHIFERLLSSGVSPWRKDFELSEWLSVGTKSHLLTEIYFRNYALSSNSSLLKKNSPSGHLRCWLDSRRSTLFHLSPIKTELVYKDPEILLFHDVVEGSVMQDLWNVSTPGLELDATFGPGTQAQAVLGNSHCEKDCCYIFLICVYVEFTYDV